MIHGIVPEPWLNSYEQERLPIACGVMDMTQSRNRYLEEMEALAPEVRENRVKLMKVSAEELLAFRRHYEQLDLNYGDSSIGLDFYETAKNTPIPGGQAPDAELIFVNDEPVSLYRLLDGLNHCLLVFWNGFETDNVDTQLTTLAVNNYEWLDIIVVVETLPKNTFPTTTKLVEDKHHVLYRRYGGDTMGLYLIRPDGYIAFKGQRFEDLERYFQVVDLVPAS